MSGVAYLWVVFCCAFFIRRTLRSAKAGRSGEVHRLRFLLPLLCCVIVWSLAIYFFARSDFGSGILILVATLFILALYFYHLRHPELLTPGVETIVRKGRSKVIGLDVKATIEGLERIMGEQKPHLKDSLSLPDLAALAGLTPHQLSEILNREMGTTFKAYINRYRVKEARRLLRESPDSSILDVALKCGFRSKSSFNKLFQEESGMTPTGYRGLAAEEEGRGG